MATPTKAQEKARFENIAKEVGEKMEGDYTVIGDEMCKYHSTYYGWRLYRAWNVKENHGKMKYFAVSPKNDLIRAKNLDGIKAQVRRYDE